MLKETAIQELDGFMSEEPRSAEQILDFLVNKLGMRAPMQTVANMDHEFNAKFGCQWELDSDYRLETELQEIAESTRTIKLRGE